MARRYYDFMQAGKHYFKQDGRQACWVARWPASLSFRQHVSLSEQLQVSSLASWQSVLLA
jgi:hypothetical protein